MAGPFSQDDFGGASAPQPMVVMGVEITPLRLGIVIGAVGCIAVGALAWFQLRPKLQEIRIVETDVQQKRSQLEATRQQIASLDGIQTDIEQARGLNDAIGAFLPTPDNLEIQLLEVNRLVDSSNATLRSFVPNPPQDAGPEVPAAIQSQIKRSTTQVTMHNSYDEGIALMGNIEQLETMLQVNDLMMRIDPDNDTLQTEFSLDAFIYDKNAPLVPVAPDDAAQS